MKKLTIDAAEFSSAEIAQVTGVDQQLIKIWISRGVVKPERTEKLSVRSRPHFSVVTAFKVKLIRTLAEAWAIGPVRSGDTVVQIAEKGALNVKNAAADIADLIAEESWMWAVARNDDAGRTLEIFAAVKWSDGCPAYVLSIGTREFDPGFAKSEVYLVLPVSEIFLSVYRECKRLRMGSDEKKPSRKKRV